MRYTKFEMPSKEEQILIDSLIRDGLNPIEISAIFDLNYEKVEYRFNVYLNECIPLQYIAALSKAKLRVGIYQNKNLYCNDFLIDLKNEINIKNFIAQVKHYLN